MDKDSDINKIMGKNNLNNLIRSDCGCYVLHNIMSKINGKLESKLPLDFRKRMYNLTLFVDSTPSNQ
jgi:hypothetical protein